MDSEVTGARHRERELTRRQLLVGAATGGAALALAFGLAGPARAQGAGRGRGPGAPLRQVLPSGQQFEIKRGKQRAVVTEVGATLRSYMVGGQEFLDTFAEDQLNDAARGQVLIPWPNRIDHGRYTFQGQTQQLPLSEPARDNAIHGLVRWLPWELEKQSAHEVVLALTLFPQDGYPFTLAVTISYALTDRALVVTTTARNVGRTALPYGAGYHPYLTVGTPTIDTATLRLPASTYFLTNDRLIPTGTAPVEGTQFDFRTPAPIDGVVMDTGFTDLIFDPDGFARVTLAAPGGRPRVELFMDSAHQFLQVFTGDPLPAPRRRRGLAVEPYTCATDAFNNGRGLQVLQPGQSFTSVWGLTATR